MIDQRAYKPAKLPRGGSLFGFTIVELLIVIAVISILAAITIVAYGAVRQRAENTATLAGVDQFSKLVQVYKTDNGDYPFVGVYGGFTYACVAQVGQFCGRVAGTADASCANIGTAAGSAILDTPIKTVTNKMPAVSAQTMQCENKVVTGALYYILGGADRNGYLLYYLKGDETCNAPAGSTLSTRTYYPSGTTACTIRYNA